jgi:hypothetical protein
MLPSQKFRGCGVVDNQLFGHHAPSPRGAGWLVSEGELGHWAHAACSSQLLAIDEKAELG